MPYKDSGKRKQYRDDNRVALNAYGRQYYSDNRSKCKGYHLKRQYGISIEDYTKLEENQGGVCAICSQPETDTDRKTGKTRSLAVDHDHGTGEIRGLLCGNHNKGLGYFEDNLELLVAAIVYLRQYAGSDNGGEEHF